MVGLQLGRVINKIKEPAITNALNKLSKGLLPILSVRKPKAGVKTAGIIIGIAIKLPAWL
jgi:formaldehyde-activating enzyme involved in methanogenesis